MDSMLQLSKKVLAISLTFVIILGLFFDLKAKTALRAKKNFSLGLIEVSGGLFYGLGQFDGPMHARIILF